MMLQPLGLFLAAGAAGSSRGKGGGRDGVDRGGVGVIEVVEEMGWLWG